MEKNQHNLLSAQKRNHISYSVTNTTRYENQRHLTKLKEVFSAPFAISTAFLGAISSTLQQMLHADAYIPLRKCWMSRSSNPTIEDFNRSRTPAMVPPSNNPCSRFSINYELYNKVMEYHRIHGCVSKEAIDKQLNKTTMNCRTVIA